MTGKSNEALDRRVLAAGSVGNILEWYDFAVYAYLAPIIAAAFFPTGDDLTSLIAAFGVFAAGYFMRPIGALWIGHIGDRHGRRAALTISILLMAIPTGLIALLPTYASAGLLAPILLTLLRLLQGISVGGEYTGSGVFLVEQAADSKRGFYGSLASSSGIAGLVLASAVVTIMTNQMTEAVVSDWGWRLAFIPGPVIGVIGYLLRRHVQDSPSSSETDDRTLVPVPIVETLRDHKAALIKVSAISASYGVSFYMVFVYLTTYLTDIVKAARTDVLDMNTAAMTLLIVLIPVFGRLSDKIGRRPVLLIGSVGLVLASYPLFMLLHSTDPVLEWIGDFAFAVLIAAFVGPNTAMMSEMFPHRVRYTGVSVAYSLPMGVLGGSTPLIATWLIEVTGNDLSPSIYLIIFAAVGVAAVLALPETRHRPLK